MDQAPKPGLSSQMFRESICSACDNRPDHRRKVSVLHNLTVLASDCWHRGTLQGAVIIVNRTTPLNTMRSRL